MLECNATHNFCHKAALIRLFAEILYTLECFCSEDQKQEMSEEQLGSNFSVAVGDLSCFESVRMAFFFVISSDEPHSGGQELNLFLVLE